MLADKLDSDLIVVGCVMHGFLDDQLTGDIVKSVGRHTNRPITVAPDTYMEATSEEQLQYRPGA